MIANGATLVRRSPAINGGSSVALEVEARVRWVDLYGPRALNLGYGLLVAAEHPLVREAFPEFTAELMALLEEEGERSLRSALGIFA